MPVLTDPAFHLRIAGTLLLCVACAHLIDQAGKVTLRYRSVLRHRGLGRRCAATRVLVLDADRDVRVITQRGELLAQVPIDPTRQYQTQKRPGQHA